MKDGVQSTAYLSLFFTYTNREIDTWKKKGLIENNATFSKSQLFKHDPYSEIIFNQISNEIMPKLKYIEGYQNSLDPWLGPAHPIRERYFNKALKAFITQHPKEDIQVMLLGTGMDTRPWRKTKGKYEKVTYIEVDKTEILDKKNEIANTQLFKETLNTNKATPHIISHPGNYLDENFIHSLTEKGFRLDVPTYILLVGNVLYNPLEKTMALFKKLKDEFKAHLIISLDYHDAKVPRKETQVPALTNMVTVIENTSKVSLTGIENIHDFAKELGIKLLEDFTMKQLIQNYGINSNPSESVGFHHCCTLELHPQPQPIPSKTNNH